MPKIIKGVDIPREAIKAGTVIFTEGSQAECFYIIKSGEVDIFKSFGKPDQFHVARLRAGRVLGEISGIDGQPRWATAVATTDVDIVRVPVTSLKQQLQQVPSWFRAIILDIVERFRATDELLVKYGLAATQQSHTVSSGKETGSDVVKED